MAVPNFQVMMLPLLRFASDGSEHSLSEARASLASALDLSQADLAEPLPSGRASKFSNRVAWAKGYLQQAGLISSTRRGHFQLTNRGRQVLVTNPPRIDIRFLEQYPEFLEFRSRSSDEEVGESAVSSADPELETPEEALTEAHVRMRAALASDILTRVKAGTSEFFEHLVVELLLKMGYGGSRRDAGQAVGRSGDEGIDGIISEDRLGLDIVYLQAKKWDGTVGRPEIQKFVGALHGKRAKKGVFITTGTFTAEALAYVEHIDPKVVLIDGRRLAEFMIDFGVGVSTTQTTSKGSTLTTSKSEVRRGSRLVSWRASNT
jgi:restriction system protein